MYKKGCIAIGLIFLTAFVYLFIDVPLSDQAKDWLRIEERQFEGESFSTLTERMEVLVTSDKSYPCPVREACGLFTAPCLEAIRRNPGSFPHLTGDEEFWELFRQSQQSYFKERDHYEIGYPGLGVWMAATRDVLLRDVALHGRLLPETIANNVKFTRRMNLQATILIERMIAVAAMGIAQQGLTHYLLGTEPEDWALSIEELLKPLTAEELGFESTLRGELKFAQMYTESEFGFWDRHSAGKPNHILNMLYKQHSTLLAFYEDDVHDFWLSPPAPEYRASVLDWVIDPIGTREVSYGIASPLYGYFKDLQMVDLQLSILRALVSFRVENEPYSQPSTSSPSGWVWVWYEEDPALCLAPDDVHPEMEQYAQEICIRLADFLSKQATI